FWLGTLDAFNRYRPTRAFYYEIELPVGHQLPPFNKPGAAQIELHWRLFDPDADSWRRSWSPSDGAG
ncbi:MAG TPA: hypothetical protein PKM39_06230, partial [Pseudothauera hydrothermalis]|nr:hypothetical protein [Pseudothauera hydrothermalis]